MSTAAADSAGEPGWYEPARLAVRWVIVPAGFFASLGTFTEALRHLASAEAANQPGLLDRVEGQVTASGPDGVRFKYTYKGEEFQGARDLPSYLASAEDKQTLGQRFPAGSSQTVFVNPQAPSTGFLKYPASQPSLGVAIAGGASTYLFYALFKATRNLGYNNLLRCLRMGR